MSSNEQIPFSKWGERKISFFIAQEMLYDFMTGRLDFERKKAMEEFIQDNLEIQTEIEKIKRGIQYTGALSETQVSQALHEKIKQPTNSLQIFLQKIHFRDWPPLARMGLEACLVAFGITIFAVLIPWSRLIDIQWRSSEVVLSEVDNQLAKKSQNETEIGAKEQISFPDEGSGSDVAATQNTTTTLKVVQQQPPSQVKPSPEAKPVGEVKVPPAKPVVETPSPPIVAETKPIAAKSSGSEPKITGFLFRGVIKMTNPKAVAPKIVEKITALGARKAGNVELGWSKGTGAYYHFTLPESKYEETLQIFNDYGELKIQKEKHERLMPDGIIRLIIDAEEKR